VTHLSEEDLVAHYAEPSETVGRHLAECPDCAAAWEKLYGSLESFRAPVPEPDSAFEARMWRRVEDRMSRGGAPSWRPLRWAGAIAAAAVLMIGAFFAGRVSVTPEAEPAVAEVRDKVLLVALREHLDRSHIVLVELSNAVPSRAALGQQQAAAGDLLASNRLLRQAATGAGRPGVASTLEDLERVLMEIARSPSEGFAERLENIREQMEDEGILFRVRVLSANLNNADTWRF
jgi:hypothetical protein